jgi:hypothetical protein
MHLSRIRQLTGRCVPGSSGEICVLLGAFRIEASRSVYISVCLDVCISYDQVKEDELGRACSTNGGEEECI